MVSERKFAVKRNVQITKRVRTNLINLYHNKTLKVYLSENKTIFICLKVQYTPVELFPDMIGVYLRRFHTIYQNQ